MDKIRLRYILHAGHNGAVDVANVCSVADKFFSDALVTAGVIPDDNVKHVPEVIYSFGSVDPKNPRMEVFIEPFEITEPQPAPVSEPTKKKVSQMKIQLDAQSVQKALVSLLEEEYFILKPGKKLVPHFEGSHVFVEIVDSGETAPVHTPKAAVPISAPTETAAAEEPPAKRKYTRRAKPAEETSEPESETEAQEEDSGSSQEDSGDISSESEPPDTEGDESEGDSDAEPEDEASEEEEAAEDEAEEISPDDEDGIVGLGAPTTTHEKAAVERINKISLFGNRASSAPAPEETNKGRASPFAGLKRPLNPKT